jgi:hypothetical protein
MTMIRPNFSGTWEFNSSRSTLEIPAPDSTTIVIEHNEPDFHLKRTHVFGRNSDTFSLEPKTDGKTVELNHDGLVIRASLQWDDLTLVFDTTLNRNAKPATNSVRYKLSDDGQVLLAEERFRSDSLNYDNRWAFDRQ